MKKILIHPAGNYKKLAAILGIIFSFVIFSILSGHAGTGIYTIPPTHPESRGSIKVIAKARDGSMQKIELYKASYALLIGVSDYTAGWPDLENIPAEVEMVANSLRDHGFSVKTVMNPDSDELEDSFEEFIDKYGYDSQNRLLFLFSGHGYTRKQGKKGYLVPVDAPDPRIDERGFVRKALSMSQINTWARQIEAKHALFLFDSCFSGTIFKTKALPEHPPHITSLTVKPVRQFITAGSSGEEVPARSVFVPSLIKGLRGEADIDEDNYITGTELGMFLHRKVMSYNSSQTPQYGKIRDPELDEGDFVLVAGGSLITDREATDMVPRRKGRLLVHANPGDARIELNGLNKGRAPVEINELAPGTYTVKAEKEGYEARTEKVIIRPGRLADVKLLLDKIVTTGSLKVTSDPDGAKWYLNGAYTGTTPDTLKNLDAGSYTVVLKKEGYEERQQSVVIQAGQENELHAELQKQPRIKAAGVGSSAPSPVVKTWTEPFTGMEFVWVEGGCYEMGSFEDEKWYQAGEVPVHEVCLDDFYIGKYEVTNRQYKQFNAVHDSKSYKGQSMNDDDQPVVYISWEDAGKYIKWLKRKTGIYFRLPTEAEWEYAARGGTTTVRYWGNETDNACQYANVHDKASNRINHSFLTPHNCDDGYTMTAPVGSFRPNDYGLYDMLGNVAEWCSDRYFNDYYKYSPRLNPPGSVSSSDRVVRGGSWLSRSESIRSAARAWFEPDTMSYYIGFRLVYPAKR